VILGDDLPFAWQPAPGSLSSPSGDAWFAALSCLLVVKGTTALVGKTPQSEFVMRHEKFHVSQLKSFIPLNLGLSRAISSELSSMSEKADLGDVFALGGLIADDAAPLLEGHALAVAYIDGWLSDELQGELYDSLCRAANPVYQRGLAAILGYPGTGALPPREYVSALRERVQPLGVSPDVYLKRVIPDMMTSACLILRWP